MHCKSFNSQRGMTGNITKEIADLLKDTDKIPEEGKYWIINPKFYRKIQEVQRDTSKGYNGVTLHHSYSHLKSVM